MEENEDECACFIRLQDFEGSLDRQFFVGLQGGFGDNKKRQSKHPQKTDRPVQYLVLVHLKIRQKPSKHGGQPITRELDSEFQSSSSNPS